MHRSGAAIVVAVAFLAACARPGEADDIGLGSCEAGGIAVVVAGTSAGAGGDYPVGLLAVRGDGAVIRLTDSDPAVRQVDPALSPDADTVYFAVGADGEVAGGPPATTEIWRQDLTSGEQRLLVGGAEELRSPAPSPDGAMVAFVAREQRADAPGRRLYVVPADGGARTAVGPEDLERLATYDLPAWRPDGAAIAYLRTLQRDDGSRVIELRHVDVVSDRVSTIHTAPPDAQVGSLSWAPDGGAIVFTEITLEGSERRVVTAMRWFADTGEIRPAGRDVLPMLAATAGGYVGVQPGPDPEGVALQLWKQDDAEPAVLPLRLDDRPVTSSLGAPAVAACLSR